MKDQDLFGFDVDAALAAATPGDAPSPESEVDDAGDVLADEPVSTDEAREPDEAMVSVDSDVGHDSGESVRAIKARGKVFKVDMNNEEKVNELLGKGLSYDRLSQKFAAVKRKLQEAAKPDPQLVKDAEHFRKLDRIYREEGDIATWEQLTGKNFDDFISERVSQRLQLLQASPEERARLERELANQQWQETQAKFDRKLEAERKRREELEAHYAEKEARNLALPEFQRVFSKLDTDDMDPVQRQALASKIWKATWNELEELSENGEIDLTPEMIRREFAKTAKLFNYTIKQKVKTQVSKALAKKKKAAKEQAGAYATRKNSTAADLERFKRMSPTDAHEELIRRGLI